MYERHVANMVFQVAYPGVARERDGGPQRKDAGDAQAGALGGAPPQVAAAHVGDAQALQAQCRVGGHMDGVHKRAQVQHGRGGRRVACRVNLGS